MLKKLFNQEVQKLNVAMTEPRLFKCLVAALNNCGNIRAHVCHQKYIWYGNPRIKKELCDVLVVLFYKDYLRFSFIQNKFERSKRYSGLSNFHIDCGQHRLLVERPEIVIVKGNFKSDILKNCRYDTATAYSVFYKDVNGNYDMDFASALSVMCSKNNIFLTPVCLNNSTARHLYNLNHCDISKEMIEYDSLLNLDAFERFLHFGEVVYFDFCRCGNHCKDDEGKMIEFMQTIGKFKLSGEMYDMLEQRGLHKYLEYGRSNNERNKDDECGFGVERVLFVDLVDSDISQKIIRPHMAPFI